MKLLILTLFIFTTPIQAKLLDKIYSVIDDNIVTMSVIKRIKSNTGARQKISPQIYRKNTYSTKEIVDIIIKSKLIHDKLAEMGYIISDDQVESRIKDIEKNLGVDRDYLLGFLNSNNFTYDEYFNLIRETIEFNLFYSRIITPLISITEQEIKNRFYKNNTNNKTLSFKYTLVDFFINQKKITKKMKKEFRAVMAKFQDDGDLPTKYQSLQTASMDDVSAEDLPAKLKKTLHKTDEGKFSNAIVLGKHVHIFYVKAKNLTESDQYISNKKNVYGEIFQEKEKQITSLWFQRERNKHYIKNFF